MSGPQSAYMCTNSAESSPSFDLLPISLPIPIAFWITELNVGGAECAMVELVTRLCAERWRPMVYVLGEEPRSNAADTKDVAPDQDGKSLGRGGDAAKVNGLLVDMDGVSVAFQRNALIERLRARQIPVFFLGGRGVRDLPRTLWRGIRLLRRQRPLLIQTFLFHANLLGCVAAKWAGSPPCCVGIRVAERRSRWYLRVERWIQRWVYRYVCVSRGVAEFTRREVGISPEKIVVIPNGISPIMDSESSYPSIPLTEKTTSLSDFASSNVQRPHLQEVNTLSPSFDLRDSKVRQLTMIGRLTYQKGLDWLLDAFAELRRRYPAWRTSLRLRLVGAGEEERSLRRQAEHLDLVEWVRFEGWTADVEKILAETNLLVLSSRWEGMPNVVLQAMRQAVPVLATQVEGVRELLDPRYPSDGTPLWESDKTPLQGRKNPWKPSADSPQIVPFGDTDAWCTKCAKLLSDPALAKRLGVQNRERAEQLFSLDAMVQRYENLWTKCLSEYR